MLIDALSFLPQVGFWNPPAPYWPAAMGRLPAELNYAACRSRACVACVVCRSSLLAGTEQTVKHAMQDRIALMPQMTVEGAGNAGSLGGDLADRVDGVGERHCSKILLWSK
jgi:hypothetical protein